MAENIISLTGAEFAEKVDGGKGVSVVDFWAAWCGPCRMLAPIIDRVAGEYADKAGFYKVNVDDEGELSARFGIMTIPTVIVFKNGEEAERSIGLVSAEALKALIDRHI